MGKPGAMRVIAGRWRGRPLHAPPGLAVRPTADRVREALFSILGDAILGAEVADLCSGSGALGIEALSRGAARVVFVDAVPAALRAVRENLDRLGADASATRCVPADAAAWLARRLASSEPLVVLADPPYASAVAQDLLDVLAAGPTTAAVPVAVLEHAGEHTLTLPAGLRWRVDTRRYGRAGLTILWREVP
jgi:16S rRNA (guanine966-N2)-methyltransferase